MRAIVADPTQVPPHGDAVLVAALDAAAVLVVVRDREGRATYRNSAVSELSGYARDRLATMPLVDRVAPDLRDVAGGLLERMWHGETMGEQAIDWVAKAAAGCPCAGARPRCTTRTAR